MKEESQKQQQFYPEEFLIKEIVGKPRLSIGIPKESREIETRLALTPEGVAILTEEGHSIYVEKGAGEAMAYSDLNYSEAGAYIVESKADVFAADIVLKITPPTVDELMLMHHNSSIFSTLQLSNLDKSSIELMMKKKMNAIAYDLIKDEQKNYPVISSIAEIEGNTAIAVASDLMSSERGGKGLLLGGVAGITPPEVVILGASITGSVAARTALGLGAMVKVFDHDINKLRKIQHYLNRQIFTSVIHPSVLIRALASADVVIGNLRYINGSERFMVSETLVETMKKGAIIVDLSIDQGGCFETSECRTIADPVFVKHGIIHYCVPNISARVGRTASMAFSNIITPIILKIADAGSVKHSIGGSYGFRNGAYIFNGIMANRLIGNYYGIPSNDIGLLLTGEY